VVVINLGGRLVGWVYVGGRSVVFIFTFMVGWLLIHFHCV
jgi:uncharacterized membrane protein